MLAGAFIAGEIEQLVPPDRTAKRAAELIVAPLAFERAGRREVVLGPHLFVEVISECRAVQRIGSALDLNADRGPAGQSLLGIEVVRHDVDRLD